VQVAILVGFMLRQSCRHAHALSRMLLLKCMHNPTSDHFVVAFNFSSCCITIEEGDARQCFKYTFLPLYYVYMMPIEVGFYGGYLKGPNLEQIFNEKLKLYHKTIWPKKDCPTNYPLCLWSCTSWEKNKKLKVLRRCCIIFPWKNFELMFWVECSMPKSCFV
jgi:hypothetical protein